MSNTKSPNLPIALPVEPSTGRIPRASRRYEKRFRDLAGLYADSTAYQALLPQLADTVVYQVWEYRPSQAAGDLVFGTSVMSPGRVGEEFFLTRGHLHAISERSEIYFCMAGAGVMLMESPEGAVQAVPIEPQAVVYVPPCWIHRSVNTGSETLITLFCYPADAGQDYEIIERAGGMRARVVSDGASGWKLADNPGWRR